MEKNHPIDSLMVTAMTSIENMIDVNTVVGDMITCPDGTVIVPVSKVCFGFAAGGSEFNTNKLNKFSDSAKLPFGGGSGAGVNIAPMGFLVVKDGNTKLLSVDGTNAIDRLVDIVPDVVNKANNLVQKIVDKPKSKEKRMEMQEQSPDDME